MSVGLYTWTGYGYIPPLAIGTLTTSEKKHFDMLGDILQPDARNSSTVKYWTNTTPPATEDHILDCSEQLQLTKIGASGATSQMARSSTGKNCCQSELQGTVENRSLVADGVAFDILCCWKHVYLKTFEYSLQVKYKGQVTTTTENETSAHLRPERCRQASVYPEVRRPNSFI